MLNWSAARLAVVLVAAGLVVGCSETGFQDFMGAGKYAPDETQVAAQQPLSVPPDLHLRPPTEAPPPPVISQPATAQPQLQGQVHQPQQAASGPQPLDSNSGVQQVAANQPQDVYARWGISRYHPDGREKTQKELNEEMRQKKLEAERQKNPNYGTIWNLGSIWSDG